MKRMLFNATQQEELRVAIVDGQKLVDIDIEMIGREQRKSNIYKGIITRIEPSLEACFINYGEDRHGFLPFKEVARNYFKEGVDVRNVSIKDALFEGQEIVIQVEKEERGNKGAALTSFISLAGRYLVLMPNNPRGGGVSRRVEGEERQELRETMDRLDLPAGMSIIARTAGIGRGLEELQWDLNYLLQLWRAIEGAGQSAKGAFLIYQESSLVIRAIRDYFHPDIGEILIDTDDIYEQAQQFMQHVMPDMTQRVKRYYDDVPLFSRFQIEHQIESAYARTVPLPSGGSIVIDHTEALASVDVNSARATRGSDIETTALNTNLEAAEEVARQLRLRDLGGLIVIDFIDMENTRNQREVELKLKDALYPDRARVQMGKISRFGLMELSRQRLRPSLSEGSHIVCPRCNGTGHVRDIESSALQALRLIQEEALKENSAAIHLQAPIEVAAFLLNEKRGEILKIESRHHISIILIPNKYLETPHYLLERIKHEDARLEEIQASYKMAEQPDMDISYSKRQKEEIKPRAPAMVKGITPEKPAPVTKRADIEPVLSWTMHKPLEVAKEFFSNMLGMFRKNPELPETPKTETKHGSTHRQNHERSSRSPRNRGRQNNRLRTEENDTPRKDDTEIMPPVSSINNESQKTRSGRESRAPAENREAKGTREIKEAREPREVREPRELRELRELREKTEARRERKPRLPKENIQENIKENSEERHEPLLNEQLLVSPPSFFHENTVVGKDDFALFTTNKSLDTNTNTNTSTDLLSSASASENLDEDSTEHEEQQKRRRRRGGRNRGRRERDEREEHDTERSAGFPSESEEFSAPRPFLPVAEEETRNSPAKPVRNPATKRLAATENPVFPENAEHSIPPAQPRGNFSAAVPSVDSTEQENREESRKEPGKETSTATVPAYFPVSGNKDNSDEKDAGSSDSNRSNASDKNNAPAAASVPTVSTAPTTPSIATFATTKTPFPVFAETMVAVDLSAVGLVMATTDPEKLQAAQAIQLKPAAPARPSRRRKIVAAPVAEPLVQVETQPAPMEKQEP